MTNLLTRIFIKNRNDVTSPEVRSAYATLAGIVGIILNILLFGIKLTVGILSFSVAIIADAFNNISDAGSSVIAIIGFRLAMKPVDKEHPLGHGRFEYISAFIVNMIIILVGFELFKSSLEKVINKESAVIIPSTFIFLGIAIFIKLWLGLFYRKIGNKISGAAIKASALDSFCDCIATTLVFITSLFAYFGILSDVPLDGIAGIIVAIFIAFSGVRAAKETISLLLGSPPEESFVKEIGEFYKKYPEIIDIHDLIIHDYGPGRKIVSFHAEVPANCDICHAHEVIDQMERDIQLEFNCIVTIHLDPVFVDDERVNELKALTARCISEVSESLGFHDFRITSGEFRTNLIFDLVVPLDSGISLKDAEALVTAKIHEQNETLYAVIQAEHPMF